MSSNTVSFSIGLTGYYFNHWPLFKVYHNNNLLFDGEIQDQQYLNFDLVADSDTNCVRLVHYGKQFGENGVWDGLPDGSEQCYININDIKFDGISIGEHIMSQLVFTTSWSDLQKINHGKDFVDQYSSIKTNGMMNFNGEISLNFSLPIMNWLILNKYKVSVTDAAYFSNYSLRWHYEKDLELLKQIKELMNLD
jgi:hypothetical protein